MEIRQLNYFVAAAEKMNFTEAAKACFITQSTLSQQIKLLEEELNAPLFNRVGKRIENLTEAGSIFQRYANRILKETEEAKLAIDDLNQLLLGELRIGVTYALSYLLIKALSSFASRYPHLQIYMEYGTSEALEQKLRSSDLDMILTFHSEEEDNELTKKLLLSSRLVVAVSANNTLAGLDEISLIDLADQELVLPGKGFSTRTFITTLFERKNIHPRIRMELNDVRSMLALVEAGNWATILTEQSLLKDWPHLKAIPLKDEGGFVQHAFILWRREIYQKKSAQVLVDELVTIAKKAF